jgi:hypothetical protein
MLSGGMGAVASRHTALPSGKGGFAMGAVRNILSKHIGLTIGLCVLILVGVGLWNHRWVGTYPPTCDRCHRHNIGTDCGKCHKPEQKLWASAKNLHSASATEVLGNPEHNSAEVVKDDCLICHSMFQARRYYAVVDPTGKASGTKIPASAYGPEDDKGAAFYSGAVSHFVSPINATGPWTVRNLKDWNATKCEVCHDPDSTDKARLSKFGAWLDTQPRGAYIPLDKGMPTAYQYVFKKNGYVKTNYSKQSQFSVHATKLCDSCHDPDDQGGDTTVVAGNDYGPQGGDSRSYYTAAHAGLGCIDCHRTHDFTSEEDTAAAGDPNCNGSRCHETAAKLAKVGDPGVVHTNHIP